MCKTKKKMPGTVRKIIRPIQANEPEKAEITVDEAEDLYKEIRIENTVTDQKGEKSKLKEGAKVDVTIEADSDATQKAG